MADRAELPAIGAILYDGPSPLPAALGVLDPPVPARLALVWPAVRSVPRSQFRFVWHSTAGGEFARVSLAALCDGDGASGGRGRDPDVRRNRRE